MKSDPRLRIGRRPLVGGVAALLAGGRSEARADTTAAPAGDKAKYHIYMILWRGETEVEHGFRDYLRDHHIDAEITVDNLDRDMAKLPAAIARAKAVRPDLVYTWGTGATMGVIAQYDKVSPAANITDIPVLFTMVTSPTASRIIAKPGKSGRNVTGVSHIAPLESQIRAMRAYRQVSRLANLYNPTESNSVLVVKQLQTLLAADKIELIAEAVPLDADGKPRADALPALVAKVAQREPQFLYIGPDTFIGDNRDVLTTEGIRYGLPAFTGTELEIRTSRAMAGLVTNYYALGKFAGFKAEQILVDRVPVGDIPIETLRRFTYMVKISVAKILGLYPPIGLLDYAEIVP
jgi:putative ABC transport system substrate-binding protein